MQCANVKKLIILILIAAPSLGVNGCESAPKPKTPLRKYAADARTQTVSRKGEGSMLTSNPLFDQMECYWTKEAVDREIEVIEIAGKCEKWAK